MLRKIVFFVILFIGITSLVIGQASTKTDVRSLLDELGSMLKEIPESTVQCQALLKQIEVWQIEKRKLLEEPKLTISITEPSDEATVPEFPYVKGTISDPNAKVWIIVRPMRESKFWIQQSVTVQDSTWEVTAHIGQGQLGAGEGFEIMAVANPEEEMKEGGILPRWPVAQSKSKVIKVTRR